jgi:hypothetical protein
MTHSDIASALDYVALCIAEHGEAYLPIFERLELELAEMDKKQSAVERARALSRAKVAQPHSSGTPTLGPRGH